ncbi:hypothetical protein ACFX2I_034751 [Malus domestica]
MGIPDKERANHQNIDQHETSHKPADLTQSRISGGRHLLAEGLEGSKAVYRDCRDFLKQRRENPLHICSKINDPRVPERLGPLPRPRLAANLGKERQTHPRSQYGESKEKSHAFAQTLLLPRSDRDLGKKIPVVHDTTQDPLVLQLLEEAWPSHKEDPRHLPSSKDKIKAWFTTLY